jgi:hypothetical protein
MVVQIGDRGKPGNKLRRVFSDSAAIEGFMGAAKVGVAGKPGSFTCIFERNMTRSGLRRIN